MRTDRTLYGWAAIAYIPRRLICAIRGHRAWEHNCDRCGDRMPYFEFELAIDATEWNRRMAAVKRALDAVSVSAAEAAKRLAEAVERLG